MAFKQDDGKFTEACVGGASDGIGGSCIGDVGIAAFGTAIGIPAVSAAVALCTLGALYAGLGGLLGSLFGDRRFLSCAGSLL